MNDFELCRSLAADHGGYFRFVHSQGAPRWTVATLYLPGRARKELLFKDGMETTGAFKEILEQEDLIFA